MAASLGTLTVTIKALDRISGPMKGISVAVGASTAALTLFGGKAVKVAADFDRAMTRVGAIAGASTDQLGDLKKNAVGLAKATEFTAREVAQGMQFMAQAGNDANTIMGAMPDVLRLASAAQIDLGRASDIVTNIMAGYGKQVEELAEVNDVLVTTTNRSNTNLLQLGEAFRIAGPVAKSAGIEFNELASAVGVLGNAGFQGELAGTALRTSMARLLSPTKQVQEALDELGVEVLNSEGRLKSLTEIVAELEPHAAETGSILTIFGQRAGPAMAALIGQGSKALEELQGDLANAGGAAQKLSEKQLATTAGQLQLLGSQFEAFQISLGTAFFPVVESVVGLMGDLISSFEEFAAANPLTVSTLGTTAVAFGTVLTVGTGILAVLPSIVQGFGLVTTAIKSSSAAALLLQKVLLPLTALVGIITTGVGAVKLLTGDRDEGRRKLGITDETGGFDAFIKTAIGSFKEGLSFLSGGMDNLGKELGTTTDEVGDVSSVLEKDFKKNIESVSSVIDKDFKKSLGKLSGSLDTATKASDDIAKSFDFGGEAAETVVDATDAMGGAIDHATGALDRLAPPAMGVVRAFGSGADTIKESAKKLEEEISNTAAAIGGVVASQFSGAVTGTAGSVLGAATQGAEAGGVFGALIAAFVELLTKTEGFNQAVDSVNDVLDILIDSLGGFTAALSKNSQIMNTAITPVFKALGGIFSALGTAVDAVLGVVRDVVGPVFKLIARALFQVTPLITTIAELFASLVGAFQVMDIAMRLLSPLLDVLGEVLGFVAGVLNEIVKGIAAVWNGILDGITAVFRSIADFEIAGAKPFEFLDDWADELQDSKIDVAGLGEAARTSGKSIEDFSRSGKGLLRVLTKAGDGLGDGLGDSLCDGAPPGDSLCEAVGGTAEMIKDVGQSLVNVPAVFNLAAAQFASSVAGLGSDGASGLSGPIEGGGEAPVSIGVVNVMTNDPEAFVDQVKDIEKWRNFESRGTSRDIGGPFQIPNTGGVGQ